MAKIIDLDMRHEGQLVKLGKRNYYAGKKARISKWKKSESGENGAIVELKIDGMDFKHWAHEDDLIPVENETLSDKIELPAHVGLCSNSEIVYVLDLKDAMTKLYNYLAGSDISVGFRTKLVEIFGEKLL